MSLSPELLRVGLVALACVVFALVFARAIARWKLRSKLGRRQRRARRGERRARRLLERAGYRVLGEQVVRRWTFEVDARPVEARVCADFVVERDGERFVADAKTGDEATRPTLLATRRQLLEYAHAFEVQRVLLVDSERGKIIAIDF